jgi:FMN reductase
MPSFPPAGIPNVVLISGNTHRPSKSRGLASYIGAELASRVEINIAQLDLVDAGPGLGAAFFRSQLSTDARAVLEAIESADALVVSTPVYKGSYPGLFKHLIDFIEPEALINRPVLTAASGGGQRHALVVEHHLRPLFGFFSALVAPTTVYASDAEFTDGVPSHPLLIARVAQAVDQFASLLAGQAASHPGAAVEEPVRLQVVQAIA